jgi:hypothetical protein
MATGDRKWDPRQPGHVLTCDKKSKKAKSKKTAPQLKPTEQANEYSK